MHDQASREGRGLFISPGNAYKEENLCFEFVPHPSRPRIQLQYNMRPSILTTLLCSLPTAISIPTQPPLTNTSALPLHFGLLLYPGFVALDAYSVVDILSKPQRRHSLPHSLIKLHSRHPISQILPPRNLRRHRRNQNPRIYHPYHIEQYIRSIYRRNSYV
jgi:hypothetical protein